MDYTLKKRSVKTPADVKLLLWRDKKRLMPFVISKDIDLTPVEIRRFYGKRFIIETYYRMMHRFQAFSCSQHPLVRYVLLSMAFWLCNFWCYFKSPLNQLKKNSRKIIADKTYTAVMFCESMIESWLFLYLQRQRGLKRG